MSLLTLSTSRPLKHVEVSSKAWFFMNHVKNHGEAAAHDHNYLELVFILGGMARHYTVSGESSCRKGDVYIIPVGSWHGYAACQNLEIINCLLSPALLQKELAWMSEDPELRSLLGLGEPYGMAGIRFLKLGGGRLAKGRSIIGSLRHSYEKEASRENILGHLLLWLGLLKEGARGRLSMDKEIAIHPSVRQAVKLLHENPERDWTLSRLAATLHLNPSYLVRIFRSQSGLAPMKYLAKVRAEKAATLLLSGKLPVGEVGIQVGWPEPKQFARSFRQHFGQSASLYRKKMLEPFLGKTGSKGLPGI